ncbi:MAG: polysaccharide deacetylase family protein [Chloroflexi bacterium]|nr:polysaccharide deacetylase family protein [Chloroflexota bacterium]
MQMDYLYQQAYTPITVSQFVQMRTLQDDSLPTKPVIITFDDAFLDFYTEALPVLKRYGFPATLYVPTAYVNGTSLWMQDSGEGEREIVSWEQLREISRNGIECGAHTHSHPQLDVLPLSQAKREIIQSKRILEEHLGENIFSFAYPYGYHTTAVKQIVREAGYTSACAVKNALSTAATDRFALARLLVGPNTDVHAFAALLEGHDWRVTTATYTRPLVPAWRLVRYWSSVVHKSQKRELVHI